LTLISIKCIDSVNDWSWDRIHVIVEVDGNPPIDMDLGGFFFEDGNDTGEPTKIIHGTFEFASNVQITVEDYVFGSSPDKLGTIAIDDRLSDKYDPLHFTGQDADYKLEYKVEAIESPRPADVPAGFPGSRPLPSFVTTKGPHDYGDLEADKGGDRWILSLDGGGLKGVVELMSLLAVERYYGQPAKVIFDMVAGTSTGTIIAAALAAGKTVPELLGLYDDEATREALFTTNETEQQNKLWHLRIPGDPNDKNLEDFRNDVVGYINKFKIAVGSLQVFGISLAAYFLLTGILTFGTATLAGAALQFTFITLVASMNFVFLIPDIGGFVDSLVKILGPLLFTPRYKTETKFAAIDKILNPHGVPRPTLADIAKREIEYDVENDQGNSTRLTKNLDIFFTAKDLQKGETIYLTAFAMEDGTIKGTYKDVLLSAAVKASSAAPIYFSPLVTLVDGGVGSYNNPAFAAAIEALYYSHREGLAEDDMLDPDKLQNEGSRYKEGQTVVWSFGATSIVGRFDDKKLIPDPSMSITERTDGAAFWGSYIIEDGFSSANQQQNFLCRKIMDELFSKIRFKRFNAFLSESVLTDQLGVSASTLSSVKLDALHADYDALREIAVKIAEDTWKEHFMKILELRLKCADLLAQINDPNTTPAEKNVLNADLEAAKTELRSRERGRELGSGVSTNVAELIRKLNAA
jgi:hypothetical protein